MFTTRVNAINGNLHLIDQMRRTLPRMEDKEIFGIYNSLLDFIKKDRIIEEEEPKPKRNKIMVRIHKEKCEHSDWDHWTYRNIISLISIAVKSPDDISFIMNVSKTPDGRSTSRAIIVRATLDDIQRLKDGEESISFLNAFGLYIQENAIPINDYSILVKAITSIPWATARDRILI